MSVDINCNIIKSLIKKDNISILIIEDSTVINKLLIKKFTEQNFTCYTATTLKDAREIISQNNIDYILLDINLPDGNGYEIIKELEN